MLSKQMLAVVLVHSHKLLMLEGLLVHDLRILLLQGHPLLSLHNGLGSTCDGVHLLWDWVGGHKNHGLAISSVEDLTSLNINWLLVNVVLQDHLLLLIFRRIQVLIRHLLTLSGVDVIALID